MRVTRPPFLPQSISLYITYHCRSQCSHCFLSENGKLNKYFLRLPQIKDILADAQAHRVFMVVLSGGEPMLHPDLFPIIREVRHRSMLPLLGITGTALTANDVRQLSECGIKRVQVSLEAPSPRLNDAIRGAGNFNEVMRGIKLLAEHDVKVNVAICLHHGNVGAFHDFLALMAQLRVSRIKLAFYHPYRPHTGINALNADEKQEVLRVAAEFLTAHPERDWIACPTHDVYSGAELGRRRRNLPVVIGADGLITAGEGGPIMGHLSDGPVSSTYATFISRQIKAYLDRLILDLCGRHGVSEIRTVSNLYPDGLVYREDSHRILIKEGLSAPLHHFTILHEIGHIATGTLSAAAGSMHRTDIETATDIWALEQLRPHLDPHSFGEYLRTAKHSRRHFLDLISSRLFTDMIYLETYCDVQDQQRIDRAFR